MPFQKRVFITHFSGTQIDIAYRTYNPSLVLFSLFLYHHRNRLIEFLPCIKNIVIDFILYYIRKYEEDKIGKRVSDIHKETFPYIESLATSLDQHKKGWDIIDWVDGMVNK